MREFRTLTIWRRPVPRDGAGARSAAGEHRPMLSHINVGDGVDCTIRELAQTIAKVVGYRVPVVCSRREAGRHAPRKLLDVTRLHQLGWYHEISLEAGLAGTTSGSLRIATVPG